MPAVTGRVEGAVRVLPLLLQRMGRVETSRTGALVWEFVHWRTGGWRGVSWDGDREREKDEEKNEEHKQEEEKVGMEYTVLPGGIGNT